MRFSSAFVFLLALSGAAPVASQSQRVTFGVNMTYQIEQGRFDPAVDFVDVAGTFNGWGGTRSRLSDPDGDGIYQTTLEGFATGQMVEYKFRINGQWAGREEFPGGGPNRRYTVQSSGNVIDVWYNDEAPRTGAPAADFAGVPRRVSEHGVVTFTDRSAGEVSEWAWTFDGGFPQTSTDPSPSVRYTQAGTYDVTLVVSSPAGRDTLVLADYIEVHAPPQSPLSWWNDAVFYEVFVRSFSDSDGDGVGDFNGLTARLDYLNDGDPSTTADLGVTALWLMPIHASPSYHGYDVVDYYSVNPDYGTMEDFRRLLREAHARGIRVIIDFVLNHSSNRHPWFGASARGEASYRDFYRWTSTRPGYSGPWGQQVWHYGSRGYYYGVFGGGMPDLNYSLPAVRDSLFDAAAFWLRDVGVDGFRLDAVKYIFEDGAALEDLPATHQFWRDFTARVRETSAEAYTVCEAWTATDAVVPYVAGGGLDTCFDFDLAGALLGAVSTGDARGLAGRVQAAYDAYPFLQVATFLANHDQNRVMSVLGGDEGKARAAAGLLLTLPGVPYLYYGEEIGMVGTKPDEHIRRPMQWTGEAGAGFTTGQPWIAPGANAPTHHVAAQQADSTSLLHWYRRLIGVRNATPALRRGAYLAVPASDGSVLAFVRSDEAGAVLVVANTSAHPVEALHLTLPPGLIAPGDHRLRNLIAPATQTVTVGVDAVMRPLHLSPYETMIFPLPIDPVSTGALPAAESPRLVLDPNHPNPARDRTTISFRLSEGGPVRLDVFNVLGQHVLTAVDGSYSPGTHTVEISTEALGAGLYTYRIRQGHQYAMRQMAVVQ